MPDREIDPPPPPPPGTAYPRDGYWEVICANPEGCEWKDGYIEVGVDKPDPTNPNLPPIRVLETLHLGWCNDTGCSEQTCGEINNCFCMPFRVAKDDDSAVPRWELCPEQPILGHFKHRYMIRYNSAYLYACFCVCETKIKPPGYEPLPPTPKRGSTYETGGKKYLFCSKGYCRVSNPKDSATEVWCRDEKECPETGVDPHDACACKLFRFPKGKVEHDGKWEPMPGGGKKKHPREDDKFYYECFCVKET